ncbi:type I pantothenate kinase [Pseudomonas sp. MSSRFD41]|uniref:type I pantothenate kinase n=1 Tax=unclassified Pseudomonas TaxID=196821 RepID=UPI0016396F74|nr:type I pantothenate kinase [Pseudomonas sp. MSSRFD41]MBC2654221.1 type I pantothenate kinase [Pseudomonas sp. MSSRFD41]
MTTKQGPNAGYLEFDRDHWAALRAGEPMSLAPSEMEALTSPTQPMAPEEVRQILLPLSRLLHLHAARVQALKAPQAGARVPYVIGVSGSVAVGKSSFARVLAALLAYWPGKPNVHLVTTDSFLFPLATLQEKNILHRKGFPESYDEPLFLEFLQAVCRRGETAQIPIYSHVRYDILADEMQSVEAPDIVILEGLNVLQGVQGQGLHALDFIDFSIYVDAAPEAIKTWYLERFVYLKNTAFQSADSYFNKFKGLSDPEALAMASDTWDRVNLKNLVEHILPTRERANLIIHKTVDHHIDKLLLRQV